jgi:hypothetical protein
LHDERRNRHLVQLVKTALSGRRPPARRLERKRQAQHADGARGRSGAARDAGAERSSPDDKREAAELAFPEVVDDGCPGGVELVRRSRRAATGDTVRLLHECDADSFRDGHVGNRGEVARRHTPGGAVTEHERGSRRVDEMQVGVCGAKRRFYLEHRHLDVLTR